jgi:hypothetical protein
LTQARRIFYLQKVLFRKAQTIYITRLMGKKKKEKKRRSAASVAKGGSPAGIALPAAPTDQALTPASAAVVAPDAPAAPPEEREPEGSAVTPETPRRKAPAIAPAARSIADKIGRDILPVSRLRRMLPDIIRVLLAFGVIAVGAAIWWKPPLLRASFPVTTYRYRNGPPRAASLYRPVAMPERYYVRLPEKIEERYEWFAIDRRREVVALTDEPHHRFLGKTAIKRGEALGLDLEFRDIDGHEWLIYFYADAIVFSNNLLTISLDTKKTESD